MSKNSLYIAYGSNLNLPQMKLRCPGASVAGAAVLEDYRLLFQGSPGHAVATIAPCKGGRVPVLVWAITPQDEANLDAYEGWPRVYRKEILEVRLNGKTVSAMVYIMNEEWPLGQPSPCYYHVILEGYLSAGFNPDILEKAAVNSA